jgi:hypothetical protein
MIFNFDSMKKYAYDLGLGIRFAILASLFALGFMGCDQEDEPIPSYLTIEPFELQETDLGWHGSISQKITHADIFMFDSTGKESISLGVFELPATIPVINKGSFSLNIDPVIKANGSSLSLQAYPFYTRFSKTINLESDVPQVVKPTTKYNEDAVFEVIEDFENDNFIFSVERDGNTNTTVVRSTQDVFEGQHVGLVKLDTANASIVAQTEDLFDLSIATSGKIYIELNYKTDVPLTFGIIPVSDNGQEGEPIWEWFVVARGEWNKIYFNLTDAISSTNFNRFAIAFSSSIPFEDGKFTLPEAKIMFDNFKLVHF